MVNGPAILLTVNTNIPELLVLLENATRQCKALDMTLQLINDFELELEVNKK